MTDADTAIIDFSSDVDKKRLWAVLRVLTGKHRVELCRFRPRRSDRQNRYYWPCFVQPLGRKMREQEAFTDKMAHKLLASMFLKQTIVSPVGEPTDIVRSTTDLTTVEFNVYLDHCAAWLADVCDIVVPAPDVYRERDPEKDRATVRTGERREVERA